ncbi:MAG: response regulator, partial [Oscillospiraceae bacterium]|nr:response regulator [Oscillospiraceae bacterium]
MKIWCIEDDENINNLITYALASQGFEAEGMTCFADMDKKLQDSQPDLFLLDIMLPDTDGITILKKLKENSSTSDIPVI